jgi:hypothetical protein
MDMKVNAYDIEIDLDLGLVNHSPTTPLSTTLAESAFGSWRSHFLKKNKIIFMSF